MGGYLGKGRRYQSKTPPVLCNKHGYSSRSVAAAAAVRAQVASGSHHPIDGYHCERCHCWRIGHRPFWSGVKACPSTGRRALCDLPVGHRGQHGGLGADGNYYVWS